MPTLETDVRNAMTNAAVDLVDAGAGANGTLVVRAGSTDLVEFDLADPAFGAAGASVAGRADGAGLPIEGTASATGTADNYQVKDTDGNVKWSGSSVGTSGTEVVLNTTSIVSGQTVNLTAMSFLMPAS